LNLDEPEGRSQTFRTSDGIAARSLASIASRG
jgi:hypothetical protein